MKKMGDTLLASVLAVAGLLVSTAALADVSGTWVMAVEAQAGSGSPTFKLTQNGQAVTGTYAGQLGDAPVTGTVKGNEITLTFKISAQGQDLEVVYTGTLDGDKVSGKVKLGSLGDGTFTGKKQ
jgi:hypothetical protein